MRCNPDIKKKIVVVGADAEAFIAAHANHYPAAEFIPAEKPPKDGTPYVFTDPEMQTAKSAADKIPRLKIDAPDPVDASNEPRNRHERRILAAMNKRRK